MRTPQNLPISFINHIGATSSRSLTAITSLISKLTGNSEVSKTEFGLHLVDMDFLLSRNEIQCLLSRKLAVSPYGSTLTVDEDEVRVGARVASVMEGI